MIRVRELVACAHIGLYYMRLYGNGIFGARRALSEESRGVENIGVGRDHRHPIDAYEMQMYYVKRSLRTGLRRGERRRRHLALNIRRCAAYIPYLVTASVCFASSAGTNLPSVCTAAWRTSELSSVSICVTTRA